ncbi:hypothetical protein AB3515_13235 [Acinetobacter baumannii]
MKAGNGGAYLDGGAGTDHLVGARVMISLLWMNKILTKKMI